MGAANRPRRTLRLERTESTRLLRALLISAFLHLLFTGIYVAGNHYELWQSKLLPKWMRAAPVQTAQQKAQAAQQRQAQEQPPMVFVQVSPRQATAEPPKNTPNYSTQNSQAANKTQPRSLDVPNIEGSQEQVIRTENVRRENFTALEPLAPQQPVPEPKPQPEPEPEERPKPAEAPGDIALARPDASPPPPKAPTGQGKKSRPASVREAIARKNQDKLAGETMKLQGGVDRKLDFSSLDAKASPFGEYDQALILAIQRRWYALLDERAYAADGRGRVVLRFKLHPDGSISELSISDNSVGEMLGLLCQKAVLDPQPYSPWPAEMRRVFGNVRNIQFTFHYN